MVPVVQIVRLSYNLMISHVWVSPNVVHGPVVAAVCKTTSTPFRGFDCKPVQRVRYIMQIERGAAITPVHTRADTDTDSHPAGRYAKVPLGDSQLPMQPHALFSQSLGMKGCAALTCSSRNAEELHERGSRICDL